MSRSKFPICLAFLSGCGVFCLLPMWICSYRYAIGWTHSAYKSEGHLLCMDWCIIKSGRLCWSRAYTNNILGDNDKRGETRFYCHHVSLGSKEWSYGVTASQTRRTRTSDFFGIYYFSLNNNSEKYKSCGWESAVPCAYLFVLLLLIFTLEARRVVDLRRALHRERNCLCAKCGYDLRYSPERCPECGTPVSPTMDPKSQGHKR